MRAICVDDEKLLMEDTAALCRGLPGIDEVKGFARAPEALAYLEENRADLALLDIDMPEMNGLELAAKIKRRWPDTAVIFLTGFSQYAVDAFSVRATGYLLKPVTREKLAGEVAYALSLQREQGTGISAHVMVQTFGNFDVFVDGNLVNFRRARCKELLACLVDRQGERITRPEAFAVMWEDRLYDRGMQKQLDVIIQSLRTTLQDYRIPEIFEMQRGYMRVCPERFVCDAYLFFQGDPWAVNTYRGEYMSNYSWASMTESAMSWKKRNSAGR